MTERAGSNAAGWEAIEAACRAIHGDVQPRHFGTVQRWHMGGPDPLDGLSAYPVEDPPHWHIVTFGMSELYDKESELLEQSGWGFEFTMRLERTLDDTDPPIWAMNFLQNIAKYVFESGKPFADGHRMNLNGPIAVDQNTLIQAMFLVEDPALGTIDTPNGSLEFLQVLGVTLTELEAAVAWNTKGVETLLRQADAQGIVRLERTSIMDDPAVRKQVANGVTQDGSTTSTLYLDQQLGWQRDGKVVVLTLGALSVETIVLTLKGRLPFGKELTLAGPDGVTVVFVPGDRLEFDTDDGLRISLPDEALWAIADRVQARRGTYRFPGLDALQIEVLATEIKDTEGKVTKVVG